MNLSLIPPQAKIAVLLAGLAGAFFAGWTANGWRLSGDLEHVKGEVAAKTTAVEVRDHAITRHVQSEAALMRAVDRCNAHVRLEAEQLAAAEHARAEERAAWHEHEVDLIAQQQAALAKPMPDDCREQVLELVRRWPDGT